MRMHCIHISSRPRALGHVVPLEDCDVWSSFLCPLGRPHRPHYDVAVPDSGEVLSGCDAIATYVAGNGQRAWRV